MAVGDKKTTDSRVIPFWGSPHFDYRPYAGVVDRARRRLTLAAERWLGLEGFAHPYSTLLLELTGQPPPDLVLGVNLHGGFFDLRALAPLSKQVPVVLRPGDSWLVTGHCACPGQCDRWLRGCGHCPDLEREPAIPRDATAFNWRRKQRIYAHSELHVIALSEWQLKRLNQSMLGPSIRSSRVIPNGVDPGIFHQGSRREARDALGLPHLRPIFLTVAHGGVSNRFKDWATLEAAVRRLSDANVGHEPLFVIVGGRKPRTEQWGSTEVRHVPYLDVPADLAAYYRAADLLVHATHEESFSNVVAEAISVGLPVVASRVAALPELVDHERTGLLVPPYRPDALAGAIEQLLADPRRRETFSAAAAKRARVSCGLDRMVDAYLDYFAQLVADRLR
ncbi:glycosyltransferase [Candidatus Methylomirabilis limnetica]